MKKLTLVLSSFALLAILSLLITEFTGYAVVDITCNKSLQMTYYYSPRCTHCRKMGPIIDDLISQGCNITKINVEDYYELALNNEVYNIPTLVIGEERLIGEFNLAQVKDLIDKHYPNN